MKRSWQESEAAGALMELAELALTFSLLLLSILLWPAKMILARVRRK